MDPAKMFESIRLPFKQGVAAWVLAGSIGYFLYIRPKWYPTIEHEQARQFTPREVEEWNQRSGGGAKSKS